jgi:hypothetical protein
VKGPRTQLQRIEGFHVAYRAPPQMAGNARGGLVKRRVATRHDGTLKIAITGDRFGWGTLATVIRGRPISSGACPQEESHVGTPMLDQLVVKELHGAPHVSGGDEMSAAEDFREASPRKCVALLFGHGGPG